MTVPTYRSREDYTGNGVTTSYPYQFRIYEASDLVVTRADTDGNEATLVLNTDYTVTGVGKYAGGNVVLTSPLASGYRLAIERAIPATQETDLRNQGAYFAETHEDVFDRLAMLLQRVGSYLGLGPDGALRTLLLGKTDIDGQGAFRARQNRIQDLADPINQQDAVNRSWAEMLLTDGSGNGVIQRLSSSASGNGVDMVANAADLRDLASSDPDKGVAMVFGATRSVATYAAVRAFTGSATRLEVGGRSNYFDGAQGVFVADLADTTSPDNDTTTLIDANGVRWKRVFNGNVNIKWAGAVGDYNGVSGTNNSPFVLKAAQVAAAIGVDLYAPAGDYLLVSGVDLQGCNLHGDGYVVTTFYPRQLDGSLTFSNWNAAISDLTISGPASSKPKGISIAANRNMRNCRLYRLSSALRPQSIMVANNIDSCIFEACDEVVNDGDVTTSASFAHTTAWFSGTKIYGCPTVFKMKTDAQGFGFIDCTIENAATFYDGGGRQAFDFVYDNLWFEQFTTANGGVDLTLFANVASDFRGTSVGLKFRPADRTITDIDKLSPTQFSSSGSRGAGGSVLDSTALRICDNQTRGFILDKSGIKPAAEASNFNAPQPLIVAAENANANFTAEGGDVIVTPGIGSNGRSSGNVVLRDAAGDGGTWNKTHPVLGDTHIWVSAEGHVRIKSGSAPTSDTDGSIANILDGSWTPTISGQANCSAVTVTAATFTRIGKRVFFELIGTLTLTASNTATGFAFTLPYNTAANATAIGGGAQLAAAGAGYVVDNSAASANTGYVGWNASEVGASGSGRGFSIFGSYMA
jgi:hypothetical protein